MAKTTITLSKRSRSYSRKELGRWKHSWQYGAEEGAVKRAYVKVTQNMYEGTFFIVEMHTNSHKIYLVITGVTVTRNRSQLLNVYGRVRKQ